MTPIAAESPALPKLAPLQLPPGLRSVMLATVCVVLSFSLLNPVLAVRLQQDGASQTAIGLFAMLPFLCVAALVPWVPWGFAKLGVGQAYRWGLVLEWLACLGYARLHDFRLWCALGLMAGLGAAAAWNATEALVAHNTPASHRGRVTGLYQTLLGAAMAVGPMLPGLLHLRPQQALWIALAGISLGVALSRRPSVLGLRASHAHGAAVGLWQAWRMAPGLAWAALVGGVFEVGLGSITSAYASKLGWSLGAATAIAAAVGWGSFLAPYPMGWLADRLRSQRLFAACATVLSLSCVGLHVLGPSPAHFMGCAILWGGMGGALYTLSLVRVAHDFERHSVLAGTSAMIAGYTAGGALGPVVSGWMLDHGGLSAQSLWLGLLSLSLLAIRQGRT